jgi:hypothetical protein
VGRRRRALAQHPALLVQLKSRPLELLDHPLRKLAAGIVRGVFSKEPAEQVACAGQGVKLIGVFGCPMLPQWLA